MIKGKRKADVLREHDERRKRQRHSMEALYLVGCKILPPLRKGRKVTSCLACGMHARKPINCVKSPCPGFICRLCLKLFKLDADFFECKQVPYHVLPRKRIRDTGQLDRVITCNFTDFSLTARQAISSHKLIYSPLLADKGPGDLELSGISELSSFVRDGSELESSELSTAETIARAALLNKIKKTQPNKVARTAFDTVFTRKKTKSLKIVQKLLDTRIESRTGHCGVAIAQECPFCETLVAADWNANDAQSILENKRHFDVCEGLKFAGQDPILALQRKFDRLKEQSPAIQQPQIIPSDQDSSSKRKKTEKKETPSRLQTSGPN